jgi:subtilisin family serine protease
MIDTMRPTRVLLLAVMAASLLAGLVGVPATAAAPNEHANADAAGRFIVTVRDGVDPRATAAEYHRRDGVEIDYVYTAALQGFAGDFSSGALGDLARDARIDQIERDGVVHATTEQTGATWGIDRIDQDDLPLNTTYNYSQTGAGVTAYIIDTGIRTTHTQFGTRASSGYDAVDGGTADDCNGHGTHVAGTVGGSTYGVAKEVTLVAVRVLNCQGSGTWAGVAAGIDWVTAHHTSRAVANMSLGGGASEMVDTAVANSIAAGVTYAVAAGNSAANACNYSPARVPEALTVGATTSSDAQASYSNYGSCVDLYAPGSSITSAWYSTTTATNTISGTSMATPHVTGAAALYLDEHGATAPSAVASGLLGDAVGGTLTGVPTGSPNEMLRVNPGLDPAPVATASISKACSGSSCTFTGSGSYGADAPSSYGWEFSDGGTGTANPITHPFALGDHTVTLTASFTGGAQATATVSVKCTQRKQRGVYRTVCS